MCSNMKSPPFLVLDETTGSVRNVSPTRQHNPATGTGPGRTFPSASDEPICSHALGIEGQWRHPSRGDDVSLRWRPSFARSSGGSSGWGFPALEEPGTCLGRTNVEYSPKSRSGPELGGDHLQQGRTPGGAEGVQAGQSNQEWRYELL